MSSSEKGAVVPIRLKSSDGCQARYLILEQDSKFYEGARPASLWALNFLGAREGQERNRHSLPPPRTISCCDGPTDVCL